MPPRPAMVAVDTRRNCRSCEAGDGGRAEAPSDFAPLCFHQLSLCCHTRPLYLGVNESLDNPLFSLSLCPLRNCTEPGAWRHDTDSNGAPGRQHRVRAAFRELRSSLEGHVTWRSHSSGGMWQEPQYWRHRPGLHTPCHVVKSWVRLDVRYLPPLASPPLSSFVFVALTT